MFLSLSAQKNKYIFLKLSNVTVGGDIIIILYSGTPGSGKSYYATKKIYDMNKIKKIVISNFAVKNLRYPDLFFYVPTEKLSIDFLIDFNKKFLKSNCESQALLVIDECSLIFNSREFRSSDRNDWLKFFSLHRKLGYDVILISQMDRAIDRQIRGNIEYHYNFRRLLNFGFRGRIISFLTFGRNFMFKKYWYQIREPMGVEYFRIRKKIFELYDTFSMFGGEYQNE